MKKSLAMLMVLVIAMSVCFATTANQGAVTTLDDAKKGSATLDIGVTVTAGTMNSFAFGFSDKDGNTELPTTDGSSVPALGAIENGLSLAYKAADSTASGSAYIYYKVKYDKPINLKVAVNGPLENGDIDVDLNVEITPTAVNNASGNSFDVQTLKNASSHEFAIDSYDNGFAYGSALLSFSTGTIPYSASQIVYTSSMTLTITAA